MTSFKHLGSWELHSICSVANESRTVSVLSALRPAPFHPLIYAAQKKWLQSAKSATSLRQAERCSCVHASVAVRPKQRQIGWWSWQQLFISGRVGLLKLPVTGVSEEFFWLTWLNDFCGLVDSTKIVLAMLQRFRRGTNQLCHGALAMRSAWMCCLQQRRWICFGWLEKDW